ncbi:hypothetical protein Gpo141_00014194 [Globisporangium polare]
MPPKKLATTARAPATAAGKQATSKKAKAKAPVVAVKAQLTIADKKALVAKAEQEPALSHKQLAAWATEQFQLKAPLNRTTVGKLLARASEIKSVDDFYLTRTNISKPLFPEVEKELVQWIITVSQQGASISGSLIQAEAANIAARLQIPAGKFKGSNGWLMGFQDRYREQIKAAMKEHEDAERAARKEREASEAQKAQEAKEAAAAAKAAAAARAAEVARALVEAAAAAKAVASAARAARAARGTREAAEVTATTAGSASSTTWRAEVSPEDPQ